MERVDFDARTTPEGVARLREIAAAISRPLGEARMLNGWAGLRPVTPDLLPIMGRDPEHPALVYACGHSRNGILFSPLTGDCVGALLAGQRPVADISPFGVERFGASSGSRSE
jgi:glycine/D-amino acid oxidase-like deaminating enzyme